ncbi:endonuclease/exonuclease/phosphatase family protein [Roseomonas sp. NAR14]|uniref:Endonuclease/exonuclease/phosphatase family protein n=1 Tax=Roseomonas acroporae TaxID=2937791 RepID=A0A9X2BSX9_9PROT|nr:endonuclease/exonuclease/phosphatase family protein [Roseomonas acroporae]MCK8782786.1 endonuclease/exonuclease/phosphatase family protein [Roseomonas acroporae]
MTWNIHAGIGADRRYDLGRVIALARRHDPDILAVQEVESRGHGGADDPFRLLRHAFGPHAVEAPTLWGEGGRYGHMLLSRWPIRDAALHDLSFAGREPRAAIAATVATPGGPLHVLAAHLGLRAPERRFQAARLAALAAAAPDPVIALGDFNEWAWRGVVQRSLAPVLPGRTRLRSFPARHPALALDRIQTRPAGLLGRGWTDRAAWVASDHLPVIVELRFAPLAQPVGGAPGAAAAALPADPAPA